MVLSHTSFLLREKFHYEFNAYAYIIRRNIIWDEYTLEKIKYLNKLSNELPSYHLTLLQSREHLLLLVMACIIKEASIFDCDNYLDISATSFSISRHIIEYSRAILAKLPLLSTSSQLLLSSSWSFSFSVVVIIGVLWIRAKPAARFNAYRANSLCKSVQLSIIWFGSNAASCCVLIPCAGVSTLVTSSWPRLQGQLQEFVVWVHHSAPQRVTVVYLHTMIQKPALSKK